MLTIIDRAEMISWVGFMQRNEATQGKTLSLHSVREELISYIKYIERKVKKKSKNKIKDQGEERARRGGKWGKMGKILHGLPVSPRPNTCAHLSGGNSHTKCSYF